MERQLKILAYLLARYISIQTGESSDEIMAEAMVATEEVKSVTDDDVETVYKRYPTKCPVRGTSTGKCTKNKLQIQKLLKDHSAADLLYIIDRYVRECTEGQVYIKNFSTFLNQLPDYGESQDDLFESGYNRNEPQT